MFCMILLLNLLESVKSNIFVKTNVGIIEGLEAKDGDYNMFMGIPYATVDPGNPFGEAIPFPSLNNVFQAFDDSARCPQKEEFNNTISGSLEECLRLNIYVPKSASNLNKLPVLVSIHGGAFMYGFYGRFSFGPKYLVQHNIILVMLNYRLSIYGFMCLDTPEVPGNQGLKDQQLGLEWIHSNIQYFGGDPKLITLYGQSAGSISVDLHLLSLHVKLYSRVIFQGGTSLYPASVRSSNATVPLRIAQHLGFITTDINEALAFLSEAGSDSTIAAVVDLDIEFWPCVEKDFGQRRFITDHPVNQNRAKAKDLDILIGYTDMELIVDLYNLTPSDYKSLTPFYNRLNDGFNFDSERINEMKPIVHKFYIGDYQISYEKWPEIAKFYSDMYIGFPTVRSLKMYMDGGARRCFLYMFSYDGPRNYVKRIHNITLPGAVHNDEIGYLFDVTFLPQKITNEDQLMIDKMTALFTNFVKYGNPTPNTTDLIPVTWLPATNESMHYLNIDSNLTTGMGPYHDRYAFWELFYILNKEYESGYTTNSAYYIRSINIISYVVALTYTISKYI